jgi:RNA polymerase sigma-70 factor (ECF subfamily)
MLIDAMPDPSPSESECPWERFRNYLLLLARGRIEPSWRGKVDASDLVQQTLLEAHRDASAFQGTNAAQQAAWLRQILARNLANVGRDLRRQKRDVARECSVEAVLDESASRLEGWLAADQSSPSQRAARQERALLLADALATLPPSQCEAVMLRHWEDCSLAEIAERLECTTAAVTGLLHRGLKGLRARLKELE